MHSFKLFINVHFFKLFIDVHSFKLFINVNFLGSISDIYDLLSCADAPDGNYNNGHLTILSNSGLMFGVINIVGELNLFYLNHQMLELLLFIRHILDILDGLYS